MYKFENILYDDSNTIDFILWMLTFFINIRLNFTNFDFD
jgi:hypothetical protein